MRNEFGTQEDQSEFAKSDFKESNTVDEYDIYEQPESTVNRSAPALT